MVTFGFVVQALDNAAGKELLGTEVIEDEFTWCLRSDVAIFFMGSMRERMV